MGFMTASQRDFSTAISQLCYANPFAPQRLAHEKAALGSDFVAEDPVWSFKPDAVEERANIGRLIEKSGRLTDTLRDKLGSGTSASHDELVLYEDLALHHLYSHYREKLQHYIQQARADVPMTARAAGWRGFNKLFDHYLRIPGIVLPSRYDPAHVFATFFQIRRAFTHIFHHLIGSSAVMGELRAAVWQSIFTHDMQRYARGLYHNLSDFTTLIIGPSGTGKELVARAVGLSRYIPFDTKKLAFEDDFVGTFSAMNLAAMNPTLIESELFGHARGAYTGAVADRIGWLEQCPRNGAVFLDEIGELDEAIQVKLLRVMQSRTFQRLGETKDRPFQGKLIAATNRNLAARMQQGEFREDLYYRLCSDIINTPSLAEQLSQNRDDLRALVHFILQSLTPADAQGLADQVVAWIDKNLGLDYAWPGNFRELEQCVRSWVIRGSYRPAQLVPLKPEQQLARQLLNGELTADQLLNQYCRIVYDQTGSYLKTAAQLGIDRRTVKSRVMEVAG